MRQPPGRESPYSRLDRCASITVSSGTNRMQQHRARTRGVSLLDTSPRLKAVQPRISTRCIHFLASPVTSVGRQLLRTRTQAHGTRRTLGRNGPRCGTASPARNRCRDRSRCPALLCRPFPPQLSSALTVSLDLQGFRGGILTTALSAGKPRSRDLGAAEVLLTLTRNQTPNSTAFELEAQPKAPGQPHASSEGCRKRAPWYSATPDVFVS